MKLIKPFFFDMDEQEIATFTTEAAKILRSGTLILGDYTARFEREFAAFIGAKHAIAVNSGSTALEILLRIQRVEGKSVLVPTNTNFATVAAVLRAGGRVVYLDMHPRTFAPTLAMVTGALERVPDAAGILWVHIGGVISADFPRVAKLARGRGVFVLEDAAHAHGSRLGGVASGVLADGAAFSFFPTKVMTTCEGGMVTTESDEADTLVRSLRNQGKRGVNYGGLHEDFGNSSRITEINALLGSIQLAKLPRMLAARQSAYEIITRQLDRAGLAYVSTAHMDRASQYKLIVPLPGGRNVNDVKRRLADDGVILGGGVYDIPCHRQPVFAGIDSAARCPNAEHWCPNHICPPLTSGMTPADAEWVGERLVKVLA